MDEGVESLVGMILTGEKTEILVRRTVSMQLDPPQSPHGRYWEFI